LWTSLDDSYALSLAETDVGYSAVVNADVTSAGFIAVVAVDDSTRAFTFENSFAVHSFLHSGENEVIARGGDAAFTLFAVEPLDRALVLSSRYPVPRQGLEDDQLPAGRAHSLSLYPRVELSDSSEVAIQYADSDLPEPRSELTLRVFRWDDAGWVHVGGAVDSSANEVFSAISQTGVYALFTIDTTATGIGSSEMELPSAFRLHQNYPNPFNASANIHFDVKEPVRVVMAVYDVLGRRVATIIDGDYTPGRHVVRFDASSLPSGVYFYQVQMGSFRDVKRMVLTK
jgi:hypothetical protein